MHGKRIGYAAAAISILVGFAAACSAPTVDSNLTGEDNATSPPGGAGKGRPGGSAGDGVGDGLAPTGMPCDVSKAFVDNCQVCHASTPKSGASTALVTWDNLQASGPGGKKVGDLVKARIHDDARIMPPKGKLPDASLKVLDDWFAAGMPKSTAACGGGAAPQAQQPLPCTPDVTIKAAKPYAMPAGKVDQYVCVGFEVNLTAKRHIIALGPHVDNDKILHHILLFQTTSAYSPEPTECGAFGTAGGAKLVSGWAPGGGNVILPPEAAYPENVGTTHWMLQLHYNNAANRPNQVDNSGFSMCSTEQLRPNDAGMVAFGSMNFSIPPRGELNISCDVSTDLLGLTGVTFFSASPHMHTTGTSLSTARVPKLGFGTPEMIYNQPKFNFENQEHVKVTSKAGAGDIMRTHCGWKNPTDQAITFGENTGDEMCYHFMSYYPDKPSTLWHLPSLLAHCTPE